MDNSTAGVTLFSGFIQDLLGCFEHGHDTYTKDLFEMAGDIVNNAPDAPVSMQLYNDMCDWIEDHIGVSSLRKAGAAIGDRAYQQMVSNGALSADAGPVAILQALKEAADLMIQDPKGRGWQLLERTPSHAVMRRTQTFNCKLQEGLLDSLVKRSAGLVDVEHVTCVREGAEFCDYKVSWFGQK